MTKTFTLTAVLLLAATGVLAQEAAPAPQEIEDASTWTAVEIATVPMGEGQEAYVQESFTVFSRTEGPLAGLAGRCLFAGVTNLATMGVEDTGTCVYQDANGDQLWERVQGASAGNAAYAGTASWIGGTGRFEGASGEITFDAAFSASPKARTYQGTGVKRGTLVLGGS
jgi:hypothetical protein